jgi:hypothetical protein
MCPTAFRPTRRAEAPSHPKQERRTGLVQLALALGGAATAYPRTNARTVFCLHRLRELPGNH